MSRSCASPILHISYWDFFKQYYTPLLKEVDLVLKAIESSISIKETAKALALKPEVVEDIMAKENIEAIDREGFLRIMMHGSSSLCRLMQRECMCGSPDLYSPAHIAYIYGLQGRHVAAVCRANGYTEVPSQALPELLSKIYVFIMR